MRMKIVALMCAMILAAATTSSFAAGKKQVPVPATARNMTFKSLRGVQYCEIWMLVGSPETGITGHYFNTSNLNDGTNKMDTCPQAMWSKVDAKALHDDYDTYTVFKNGPRGWTMDSVTIPVGPVDTFDGLKARWWGKGVLPKGADFKKGLEPYKPLKSHRKSVFTFKKGEPVFIIEDAQGTPWVMQAFSKIVDPAMSYNALKTLGDRIKPASGWKYRVAIPEKDLVVSTPKGYNWIVQDEFGNTYDACKEGACNFQP
ncbi:hypothetical protein [Solidesulfovibrio fructosivorans]|nr:hypothetical protein [Solidesulfovibrio fructosivorans]